MFVLFLSEPPSINPHYARVRHASEVWLSKQCSFDEPARRILFKTDFSYFCAVCVPHAAEDELRTVCDWGNWVFPFDDMFDNGGLKDDPRRAEEVIGRLLAGMGVGESNSGLEEMNELVRVHNSVWQRIATTSSIGICLRFSKAMRAYCTGTLAQVRNCSQGEYPSISEMLNLRRQSSGVSPLFALIEYAHKLALPDYIFESESIQEIERIGIDLVLLFVTSSSYLQIIPSNPAQQPPRQNDILSYSKEEKENVTHNMIAICRHAGMPAQLAFDHINDMLLACYRDWYRALAGLPSWGERVDADVQRYIRGVQNVVQANLNWSFRSGRYFGEDKDRVRKEGVVVVRAQKGDVEGYSFSLSSMGVMG
ncbi:hypothetical protein FE257_008877 [Aspergillus nanangensis]|uniref:Terpene synthase n=1 Tax=Aspergillus nanangensis TaxID=2582783 RepID=A0AAD4GYG8_ASPNN|nr:hypothetical protein FE257_008877 [Aspergillus nanangensis]